VRKQTPPKEKTKQKKKKKKKKKNAKKLTFTAAKKPPKEDILQKTYERKQTDNTCTPFASPVFAETTYNGRIEFISENIAIEVLLVCLNTFF
jgi:hypothetical protein